MRRAVQEALREARPSPAIVLVNVALAFALVLLIVLELWVR